MEIHIESRMKKFCKGKQRNQIQNNYQKKNSIILWSSGVSQQM